MVNILNDKLSQFQEQSIPKDNIINQIIFSDIQMMHIVKIE